MTAPTESKPSWRQHHLWPKRIIAIAVVLMTLYPIYEYQHVTTPVMFVPMHQSLERKYTSPTGFIMRLSADLYVNFTAKGSLSVNNPITISAIVTPNDTNFMDDYQCLSFTSAYNASNLLESACLAFTSLGNGYYSSSGKVVWLVQGPSWAYIVPQGTAVSFPMASLEIGDPVVVIGSVSDTLSFTATENSERLTWVLIAFSFLMLQPVVEALCVRDTPEKTSSAQAKSEGFWHQSKLMRKLRRRQREAKEHEANLAHTQPRQ